MVFHFCSCCEMEDVYAEAMAAVAAIEGILEGHGATFTKTQAKELLHHLVKAARAAQRHVQRFEEAKQYAATAVTVMHTPKATLPCFACGKSESCWKNAAY